MSDSNDDHPYVSTGKSIRQIVFDLMNGNKDITPSQIMFILQQSFGDDHANKQTVKNYMVEWRNRNAFSARPPRPHNRTFRWLVERSEEREGLALNHGWMWSKNRNRMLFYKYVYGTVHWHKSSPIGNVLVYIRGQASLAMAKETFCRAFETVLAPEEITRLVDAPIHEMGRQWVFDLGQPLPRFEIRHFEKSHGLRIYSDGSHPMAIEVAETEPFWIHRMDEMAETIKSSTSAFGTSMNEHIEIIKTFRDESNVRSNDLSAFLKELRSEFRRRRRRPRKAKKKQRFWDRFKFRRREKKREEPTW